MNDRDILEILRQVEYIDPTEYYPKPGKVKVCSWCGESMPDHASYCLLKDLIKWVEKNA